MHEYFGEQLKKERKKLGLTVQVLSESCGTSRSYITLIENGKRLPGKTILPKIALALKLKNSVVLNWYLEDIRVKMSTV
jgi:transcriptional regulator with XRE-family HTH domain